VGYSECVTQNEINFRKLQRDVEIVSGAYDYDFKVRGVSSSLSDELVFDADTESGGSDNFVGFTVEYTYNDATLKYDLAFISLIEYVEGGSSGSGFDVDEDVVVQTFVPTSFGYWMETTPDDSDYIKYSADTSDGVVTLNVYVSGVGTSLPDGTYLSGNSVKFDFIINDFTYEGTDSQLALKASISSTSSVVSANEDEDGLVVSFDVEVNDVLGQFSWTPYVSLGDEESVADLVVTTDSENVYFAVDTILQPTMITWDPVLQIQSSAISVSTTTVSTSGASHACGGLVMMVLVTLISMFFQ